MRPVNPNIKLTPKKVYSAEELLKGIEEGNRICLSIAITYAESRQKKYRAIADQVLMECSKKVKQDSYKIGITGTPGVGKSTFIEALGQVILEEEHNQVAVLAVDPSSAISRGSILGDKTRMEKLAMHPRAYIRPTSAANYYGGVARHTYEAILLCEAAGYNYLLIETVGVGQTETEVRYMCDFFLLLLLAGSGDELQGMKRGIMEMADGIVLTKSDMFPASMMKKTRSDLLHALHFFPPHEGHWKVFVEQVSAARHTGIDTIFELIKKYRTDMQASGFWEKKRLQHAQYWFQRTATELILDILMENKEIRSAYEKLQKHIQHNALHPVEAMLQLKQQYGRLSVKLT